MVATSILSTDAEMIAMQGENVSANVTDGMNTAWGLQAEAYLAALAQYDFSTNVGTLTGVTAEMLSEYVARYVGVSGITYNMSGYTDRIEAEDMINFHWARLRAIEKLLSKQTVIDFVK